jgi:hypothetical protein
VKRQRTAEALDFLVPLEARGARELEGRAGVNVAVVTSQLLGRVAPVDSLAFPLNPPGKGSKKIGPKSFTTLLHRRNGKDACKFVSSPHDLRVLL